MGVGASQLTDAVADAIPKVAITSSAESGNQIQVSVQAKDCQENANANRFLFHVWLSGSQYGSESASSPSGGVTVGVGTLLGTLTTGKRWTVISNSSGLARLDITEAGVATFYVNVELDGRVYASSAINFS